MSRSLTRWQALLLGLVLLLAVGLAAAGLFAVGRFYGNAFTVGVGFPEIRGVEVGTRVRIQGIDAGEVVALEAPANPGEAVVLRLRLKGAYRHLVRTRSRVQIISEGMLGSKVLEVIPGPRNGPTEEPDEVVAEGAMLTSLPTTDLADLIGEVGQLKEPLIGALNQIKDTAASFKQTSASIKDTSTSFQQVADGVQRVPLVGGYVENPVTILERPNSQRDRRVFAEADLFEPGQAILTVRGREHLDEIAPWLEGMKHKGSEVVVVAYADPGRASNPPVALRLTRLQSEAVCEYLKSKYSIQKMGWFSSRKVTPLGQGLNAPPTPEREPLPPGRLEVQVFVPVRNS